MAIYLSIFLLPSIIISSSNASEINPEFYVDSIGSTTITPIQVSVSFSLKDKLTNDFAGSMSLGCNASTQQIGIYISIKSQYPVLDQIKDGEWLYFYTGKKFPPYLSVITSKGNSNMAAMIGMKDVGNIANHPASVAVVMDIIADNEKFEIFSSRYGETNDHGRLFISTPDANPASIGLRKTYRQVTDTCKKLFGVQF